MFNSCSGCVRFNLSFLLNHTCSDLYASRCHLFWFSFTLLSQHSSHKTTAAWSKASTVRDPCAPARRLAWPWMRVAAEQKARNKRVIYPSAETTRRAKNRPIQDSVERGCNLALLAQQSVLSIHPTTTLPMGFANPVQMCQWASLLAFSFKAFHGPLRTRDSD